MTEREVFKCIMSLCPFSFLLRAIRFDDPNTRTDRIKENRLDNYSNIFDEILVAFRGRCITKKPAEVCIRKSTADDRKIVSHPTHVVFVFVNTNRNIIADKWYASIEVRWYPLKRSANPSYFICLNKKVCHFVIPTMHHSKLPVKDTNLK